MVATVPPVLRVDQRSRRVWVDGAEVVLTSREFDILSVLTADPGAAIPTDAFKPDNFWTDQYVRVWMSRLRARIGTASITTLHGWGYRLDAQLV